MWGVLQQASLKAGSVTKKSSSQTSATTTSEFFNELLAPSQRERKSTQKGLFQRTAHLNWFDLNIFQTASDNRRFVVKGIFVSEPNTLSGVLLLLAVFSCFQRK